MALYVPGVPKKIFMRSHLASDITNRYKGRLPAVGAFELYTFGKLHIRIMELTAKRAAVPMVAHRIRGGATGWFSSSKTRA
jgi:hypothetical protein